MTAEWVFVNMTEVAMRCHQQCVSERGWSVLFFLLAYLFLMGKEMVTSLRIRVNPKTRTGLAFGFRLAFHFMFWAGVLWWLFT